MFMLALWGTWVRAQLRACGDTLACWQLEWAGCQLAASYHVPPMSSRQRLPSSVSEQPPLDPLRVSPQVFSSAQTFVLTLLSPFGSVSDSTSTFFSCVWCVLCHFPSYGLVCLFSIDFIYLAWSLIWLPHPSRACDVTFVFFSLMIFFVYFQNKLYIYISNMFDILLLLQKRQLTADIACGEVTFCGSKSS